MNFGAPSLSLDLTDQHFYEAAIGYCELGMFAEAKVELEHIDVVNRAAPEVLRVRVAIYEGLKDSEALQVVAARLAELEPTNVQWTLSLADATRRAVSIESAQHILLAALPRFPDEATIPFNLACYFCQSGDLVTAKKYLCKAFTIDSNLRAAALEDAELAPLWCLLNRGDCWVV